MLWHAMPPELNTARLMAGAGPGPMLQAAAAWEALAKALETQAAELAASLVALGASWTGESSERAIAAATPTVAWLHTAAQQAQQRAMQATAQAASYVKALATTPSLPEIGTNHITHAVLTATNFLGINLVPIGFNETDYFVRMWNQAGGAMEIYQAETAANTAFESLPPMKPILQPGAVGESVLGTISEFAETVPSQAVLGAVSTLAEAAENVAAPVAGVVEAPTEDALTQFLSDAAQVSQLSGPMQQLMMPMQQLMSLTSQTRGMTGGLGPTGPSDESHTGQMGLLGVPPLSNHPLAGGSGPNVGLGLMHAESLPGAGGTSARSELMSRLIDRAGQPVPAATTSAGAGSSATGGAAPIGTMGPGGQLRPGPRPAAAPAPVAEQHDEDQDFEFNDQDDGW